MAKSSKPSKHAPYSKKVLIPLWTIQLGLSAFLFFWTILSFVIDASNSSFRSHRAGRLVLDSIKLILSFILSALHIFTIVKFAKFELTTKLFKSQSIATMVIWALLMIIYLGTWHFFDGIFPAAAFLASIWMYFYVMKVRRRVLKGEAAEMKRPVLRSGDGERDVELHGGRDEIPVGTKVLRDAKGASMERTAWPRPSLSSVATGGEAAGPPKEVREFV